MEKSKAGAGITPVGLISLLALVVIMVGVAWTGNRVYPLNSQIDSAWRNPGGNAAELSSELRNQGFTCSDERGDGHYHRLCARYADGTHASVEFSGPQTGEVMRVYADPGGSWTPESRAGAERAIELSVPDAESQRRAKSALAAGAGADQEVSGGWGRAGYEDAAFVVARTWTGPDSGDLVLGGNGRAALVPGRLAEAGYSCSAGEPVTCRREANGARWTLTFAMVAGEPPLGLSRVSLQGDVVDPRTLDPGDELATVLGGGVFSQANRLRWFVDTADEKTGHAGFARGIRMDYRVTTAGDVPTRVSIDAASPCRVDGSQLSC